MAAKKKKGEPPNKTKSVATRGYPKGHAKNPYVMVAKISEPSQKKREAAKKSPQGRANAKKSQGTKTRLTHGSQAKKKKK